MLEVIGRGAFGVVWLAVRKHDGHQVAVKVLPKKRNELTREESLANIKREVALWGNISSTSRYVAQLIGLYEDAGSVYLVQQLCTGGDLASAIKDGPLPESCAAAVMWCVMAAIRDCHEHRTAFIDVKPANFLLTSAPGSTGSTASAAGSTESTSPGSSVADLRLADVVASGCGGPCVVACDFGCSASYAELMRGAKRAGSPVFFAPEQFTSSYGLGVDVWAAGVMAYLVLTGRYPFWDCPRDEMEGQMPAYQIMLAVCSAPISFSGPEWRGLSREARDLVSRMLDRNPGTRITAAEALEHPWFQRWKNAPPSAPAGSTSTSAAASTASAPGSPRRDAGQRRSSNSAPSTPRVRPRPGPSTLAPAPAAPAPVRVPEPAAAASASADSADERAADHELQVQPPQPQPQRSPAGAVPRRRTSSGGAGLGNIVPLTFSASASAIAAAANASQAAEPRVVLPASAQQPMLSDASEDETACVQEPYRTPAGASPSH
ncbi:hypothetical protein HYH03_001925 [Edaphochlamys debaryana]|uniref:Protein kinase domain-containing protein n=1 Tax=Edaphochlamys debaryana TaxID=47281 RepID=A0A836C4N4_9CHLO|nr:hypothetical protein HYH03_001925 [Edaphochlamys debaryana]|eukprot:KAG2500351.1 hypothetical protein HYH03_001925 [Edaphochlamys debaryana]